MELALLIQPLGRELDNKAASTPKTLKIKSENKGIIILIWKLQVKYSGETKHKTISKILVAQTV